MLTIAADVLDRSPEATCPASTLYDLKNATSFIGIPLFSDEGQRWINAQTGTHMTPKTLYSFGLRWQDPRRLYTISDSVFHDVCQLPQRLVVERHVSAFCSSFESLVFPVAGKSLFDGILDLAYSPNDVPSSSNARACVYAFLSLTSVMNDDASETMSTESYASTTMSFIPQILQDITPEGLQALVTLVRQTIDLYLISWLRAKINRLLCTTLWATCSPYQRSSPWPVDFFTRSALTSTQSTTDLASPFMTRAFCHVICGTCSGFATLSIKTRLYEQASHRLSMTAIVI